MDFHALIAKINTINNAPAATSTRQITQESEFPMMGNASAPVGGPLSPPPHPSMHVNIDAQGVDNIEDIFRLMQKLNPDMDQTKRLSTPLPTPISPIPGTTDFDDDMDDINADLDLHSSMDDDLDSDIDDVDSDMDDELDHKMHELEGDLDSDGDVDNDDLEGDDEIILGGSFDSSTDEDGGFQSSTTRPSSRYRDMDYMNDELAGGMNGPKKTYPKVAGGDNPMQSMDESRSRFYEAIRSDLRSRLAETKKSSVDAIKKAKLDISKKAKATKAKSKANMEESRLNELDASTLASYANKAKAKRDNYNKQYNDKRQEIDAINAKSTPLYMASGDTKEYRDAEAPRGQVLKDLDTISKNSGKRHWEIQQAERKLKDKFEKGNNIKPAEPSKEPEVKKDQDKSFVGKMRSGLSSLKKRVFGEEFDLTDSDTPTLDRYRNRAAGQSNRANHVKSSNRPGMHESIYSNNVARRANSSNRKK